MRENLRDNLGQNCLKISLPILEMNPGPFSLFSRTLPLSYSVRLRKQLGHKVRGHALTSHDANVIRQKHLLTSANSTIARR